MDEILQKTLDLVYSSKRKMPAHFSSYGKRNQSFCIDFEPLNEADDYEMASHIYSSQGDYFAGVESKISAYQYNDIILCAEDIMLGSYIITKLGRKDLIPKMKETIIFQNIESYESNVIDPKQVLKIEQAFKFKYVIDYLNHCSDFGKMRASRTQGLAVSKVEL
jgi:hypothetical protein